MRLWRDTDQSPGWSDQLKRSFHLRDQTTPLRAKFLFGSILSFLLAAVAVIGDFGSAVQFTRGYAPASLKTLLGLDKEEPIYKGFRELESDLKSLDFKHLDSPADIDVFLRKLRSRDPKDLEIALSCIERVIEREKLTASDEMLSRLRTALSGLLLQQGRRTDAISQLVDVCQLSFKNLAAVKMLRDAYKDELRNLRATTPIPRSLRDQRQIDELIDKIDVLEEELKLSEQKLSLLGYMDGDAGHNCSFDCSDPLSAHAGTVSYSDGYNNVRGLAPASTRLWTLSRPAQTHWALDLPSPAFDPVHADGHGWQGGAIYAFGNFVDSPPTKVIVVPKDLNDLQAAIRSVKDRGVITLAAGSYSTPSGTSRSEASRIVRIGILGSTSSYAHLHLESAASGDSMASFERNKAARYVHFDTNGALAVGVNGDEAGGLARLRHADDDARRVAAALSGLDFRSKVLINNGATKHNIMAELSRVVQASQPGDTFVFYFSGHGFTDIHGRPVLVTGGDTTASNVAQADGGGGTQDATPETLSLEEVNNLLSFHRGRAVVILDNCLNDAQFDSRVHLRSVAGPNPPTFLLAGEPGGRAIESSRLGSGLFTFTLLRFLEQQRTDDPGLDFAAMYRYTAAETLRLARELYGVNQRPQWLLVR
jgi:hypothetical protein